LKKNYLFIIGISLFLVSCGVTPNVSLSLTQYQCAPNSYGSNVLKQNINLPATAGYCAMVTVTNKTSGYGANNIQTINSGFTVNNVTLCDSTSSGQSCTQSLGNLYLFDPNNCVTTTGGNVHTLLADGGTCSFYLQIANEATPLGITPIAVSYTYTNGNATYMLNGNLYEDSRLYMATKNGVISYNGFLESTVNTANTSMLTSDSFGTMYSYDTGLNKFAVDPLKESSQLITSSATSPSQIIGDTYGNVDVLSSSNMIYQYSQNMAESVLSSTGLSPVNNLLMDSLGNLYAVGTNLVESCNIANGCGSWSNYISGSVGNMLFNYNTSSLVEYAGTTVNVYATTNLNSAVYSTTAESSVNSIATDGVGNFYMATANGLYMLPVATSYAAVSMSSGTTNTLNGSVTKVIADNSGDVYAFGNNMSSIDITGTTNVAWYNSSTASAWKSIPITDTVNSAVVLTKFSLY